MSDNYHSYQLLLKDAALLYEKHDVGCPDPFNVFSVLHKETDEVNLHSRFLHALLDHRKSGDETRENLKDFLQHVGVKNFELGGEKVERECYFERHNAQDEQKRNQIDILITNADKKAVALENKTNPDPKDEDKQLWRYYNTLKEKGYSTIHLLYLTLDGRKPPLFSIGDLDPEKIITISYKALIPWLERCQKRAYDEPTLRESVAQYLQLVRKLTRTDSRGKYMNSLKKFCLEDDNFVLIRDLKNAMCEVETELLKKLWDEIEYKLRLEIPDLPARDRSAKELCYRLSTATRIEVRTESGRIWFGVYCSEEAYDELKKALEGVSGVRTNRWYPWYRHTNADLNNPDHFKLLANDKDRQEYAKKIAQEIAEHLKELLEVLEDMALVNAIKEGEKTELVSEEQIFEILERIS